MSHFTAGTAGKDDAMKIGSMRVKFAPHDREPLEWGLEKAHKMAENVVKMSTFLRIESGAAARHAAACDRAKTLILTVAERAEGFAGEVEVPDDVREVLFTASLVWLRRLNDNVIPEQTKLTIGLGETEKRRQQVENLRDRLEGKLGIFDAIPAPEEGTDVTGHDNGAAVLDAGGKGDADWLKGPEAHRRVDKPAAATKAIKVEK